MSKGKNKVQPRNTGTITVSLDRELAEKIHDRAKKTYRTTSQYFVDRAIEDLAQAGLLPQEHKEQAA